MAADIVYLRGERVRSVQGGADLVSGTVLAVLKRRFGETAVAELYADEIARRHGESTGPVASLGRSLVGRYPACTRAVCREVEDACAAGARLLFVDQSMYALACRSLHTLAPRVKIAVLFHNIERRFYLERALRARRPHNFLLVPGIARAERLAVRRAHLAIVLSDRDSRGLQAEYGRPADLVLPPGLEDRGPARPVAADRAEVPGAPARMLFAGSAFPPNVEGVRWFIRQVLPRVEGTLTVAGRGFEEYRTEFESDRVHVPGGVPDLRPYYQEADLVVSPIFWGSGIKMKTAEAFMYGLPLVGSAEALEGYDADRALALRADSPEAFAAALAVLADPRERARRGEAARRYFTEALSAAAAEAALNLALDRILPGGRA